METKDHLYLAKLITGSANISSKIKKTAFEYGCISPDVNPLTYVKGHTYAGTASYVKKTLTNLHGKLKSPIDYFDFGRAMHYVADYFTFPHTPLFKGNLSGHIEYEGKLHNHIITQQNEINEDSPIDVANAGKCISLLEKLHNKYYNTKASVANDWNYIRFICSTLSMSTFKVGVKVPKFVLAEIGI